MSEYSTVKNAEDLKVGDHIKFLYTPTGFINRIVQSIDPDGGITLDHSERIGPEELLKWVEQGNLFFDRATTEFFKRFNDEVRILEEARRLRKEEKL